MQVSIAQRITRCNSALKIGYKRLEIGGAFLGFPAFSFSSHVSASVFALVAIPATPPFRSLCCCERNSC